MKSVDQSDGPRGQETPELARTVGPKIEKKVTRLPKKMYTLYCILVSN